MFNKEYIYVRQVNQSSVHIGRTTDLEERYKLGADQFEEDFNDYICAFECNNGAGQRIENDIKKKFKKYNIEREIYNYSPILLEEYKNYLIKHPEIIRELSEEEVLKYNKNKQDLKVIVKEKQGYQPRNLKKLGMTRKKLIDSSNKMAKSIQKDNNTTKYTEHDEHYTRYEDIEKMVEKFKEQFSGKVVFCNCDDPLGKPMNNNKNISDCDEKNCSQFALYFKRNFKRLKLKKLICLHFAGLTDIFNIGETIGLIYTFDGKPPVKIKREADFSGSFYDQKSIDILNNEADIVCTNHPWSLTKKFYKILFDSKKKFLVISNAGIVGIPSFFDVIKNKELRPIDYCKNFFKGKMRTPVQDNGAWMTNLDFERENSNRIKFLPLKQIPEKYIKIDDAGYLCFDNCYIPTDYNLPFAVSIGPIINGILELGYDAYGDATYLPHFKGKEGFRRLLIKKSTQKSK